MPRLRSLIVLLWLFLLLIAQSVGQHCDAPPIPPFSPSTMLTVDQEGYVGDVLKQSLSAQLKILEVDELVSPLQRIGARLQSFAPPDSAKFHFYLIDLPEANAFTIAGGHVFVTRKAVALARNEDEIAGVLAHEMGHVLTRQMASEYRQLFRDVLKVNELAGRDDVEDKFHELMDKAATNPKAWSRVYKHSEKDQLVADQMSLYLAARAGYSTAKFADFFDRLAENGGRKGNWFTDVFGATTPDSKRYRAILKAGNPVPEKCIEQPKRMADAEFDEWKHTVVRYRGFGKKESLPQSTRKLVLQDPLREQITHLRFSPDGKYVLAQDGSSIYVLSRDPFKPMFRIDAENALPAQFSPDSRSLVFHTASNHVERWDLAQQQQTDADEVYTARSCVQSVLSPSGMYLACLHMQDRAVRYDLDVFDVRTGDSVWKQKEFFEPTFFGYLFMILALSKNDTLNLVPLAFSPDERFLVGSDNYTPFVYDLRDKKLLPKDTYSNLREFITKEFIFVAPDLIFGRAGDRGEKSSLVQFPGGKVVNANVGIGPFNLSPAARGSYAILRPIPHGAAGIMDLNSKEVLVASKTAAIDVYDGTFVSERKNGEIGLYQKGGDKPAAVAQLPLGPLSHISAVAISPDTKFLIYSEPKRGAIWSLEDGSRLAHVRGFSGGHFGANDQALVTFPSPDSYDSLGALTKAEVRERETEKWKREELKKEGISTIRFDPLVGKAFPVSTLEKRYETQQIGPYLLVSATASPDGSALKERELEFRNIATGEAAWKRKFKSAELPNAYYNVAGNTIAYIWNIQSDEGKSLLKSDPALKAQADRIDSKRGSVLLEALELSTGKRRFVFPVDTGAGSFHVEDVDIVGDTVVISDSQNRLLILDSKGQRKGRLFGRRPVLAKDGKLIAARIEPGRVGIFQTANLQSHSTLTFPGPVAYAEFSDDSRRLVVITVDQTIYTVNLNDAVAKK